LPRATQIAGGAGRVGQQKGSGNRSVKQAHHESIDCILDVRSCGEQPRRRCRCAGETEREAA
jgi:hypothetical protein